MSTFTVFMRSIGGGSKECEVSPDTPIETLRQEHSERENVPEFHEVRLYHSNTELSQSTVGDAGLLQGSELSVVVSAPEQHKLMEIMNHLREKTSYCDEDVRRWVAALRLLGQDDTLERATVDALLEILLDGSRRSSKQCQPICIAVGEVFGRVCNPASAYIGKLIDCLPRPESIIALNEIDIRGEFPLEQKVNWARQNMGFCVVYIDAYPESALAFSRLIARMRDRGLSRDLQEILSIHKYARFSHINELVYQEAMKILGSDTEYHGGARDGRIEGADESLGSAQAQQEGNAALHKGEPVRIQSDPIREEQADLQKALLLSKSDSPSLSGDAVVIFRLTRFSQDIEARLCTYTKFAQRVNDAGCKVRPDFSEGIFLVPITAEQYKELGLDLQKHHALALRGDGDDIAEALRPVPKTKRPRLHYENHAMGCKSDMQEQLQPPYMESPTQEPDPFSEERVLDHVARIFIDFNMRQVSEVSSVHLCHSAPAGDAETVQRRTHRGFK